MSGPITIHVDGREERFATVREAGESLRPLAARFRQDSRQRRDSRIKLGHAAAQVLAQAPHGLRDRWVRAMAAACELNVHTLRKAIKVAERFADERGEFDAEKYAAARNEHPNRIAKLLTRPCQKFSVDPNDGPSVNELEELASARTARAPVYREPELPDCGPAPDGVAREPGGFDDSGSDEEGQGAEITVVSGVDAVAIAAAPARRPEEGVAKARRPDVLGQAFLASVYEHCGRLTDHIGRVRAMLDRGMVPRELAELMARFDDELGRALERPVLALAGSLA